MRSLSEKEFDRYFQEAAEGYNPDFNPKDWEQLSARLDKKAAIGLLFKAIYLLAGISVLIALFLFSGILNPKESQEDEHIHRPPTLSEAPISETEDTVINSKLTKIIEGVLAEARSSAATAVQQNKQTIQTENNQEKSGRQAKHNMGDLAYQHTQNLPDRLQGYTLRGIYDIPDEKLPIPTGIAADSTVLTHKKEEESQTESTASQSKLWIKAAISPDLTSIGLSNPYKVGINAGLAIEYTVAERVTILTGIYFTGKSYYDSNPETSGYNAFPSPYNVNGIAGQCSMLDIPLNIYLHTKNYGKTSLYIGMGTSSYIMFNEEYTYLDARGYELYQNVYNNTKIEWFAVANLAIGINRYVSPNLSIQLEPYFKGALYELGDGNTRMNSMGMFINLRYRIK